MNVRNLHRGTLISASLLLVSIVLPACGATRLPSPFPPTGAPTIGAMGTEAAHAGSPGSATMSKALVAKDVDKDPLPGNTQLADSIRLGAQIFNDTPTYAKQYVPTSTLTCASCHANGGQKVGALPLAGVAPQFPEYNTRANRIFTLTDRILDCFARSMSGTRPPADSKEAVAVAAYITWISQGQPAGQNPPWRGQNKIADANLIPIAQLDATKGEHVYAQNCAMCHQANGQGTGTGPNAIPPLWGDKSFNDGAGAARLYTLAGFIRYAMPLSAPGSLNDNDAQQVAAYLLSQNRPAYPTKDQDYVGVKMPVDAVYYPQQYPQNPLRK